MMHVRYMTLSKDRVELTDKENKQYQGILNTALELEEKHKFLKRMNSITRNIKS